jgi:hypothetical protein
MVISSTLSNVVHVLATQNSVRLLTKAVGEMMVIETSSSVLENMVTHQKVVKKLVLLSHS